MDAKTRATGGLSVTFALFQVMLQLSDYHSPTLAAGLMVAMIFTGAYAILHGVNVWRENNKRPLIVLEPIHIIVLGLLITAGGVGWQFYSWSSGSLVVPEITLKYIYSHEFSNFLTQDIDFNMNGKVADKPVAFSFSARMVFDFEHRARWIAYYIPPDENTFGISIWLVTHTDDIVIPKMDSGANVKNDEMLGSGALSGRELTFSRRIYIYHEMILTDSEMAEVQHAATEKNLNVVFRGIKYKQSMRNKK